MRTTNDEFKLRSDVQTPKLTKIPRETDQSNFMNKALIAAFQTYRDKWVGILRVEHDEESKGTAEYLQRLAITAGAKATVGIIDTFNFTYSKDYEKAWA